MQKKPRVIFINQAAAYLTIDILHAFKNDHECILYTGRLLPLSAPLSDEVKVHHLTRYDNSTTFRRIFTWGFFTVQAFIKLLFAKKPDALFIVTNPPTAPFLGWWFKKLRGIPYHLLVYDVYPDALVQLKKIGKSSMVNRWWSTMNTKVFKEAQTIFSLSPNMADLIRNYYPEAAVHIIPNWADTSAIKPVSKKENEFAREHEQVDKITVMYSGNMGATHAIERIADLALAFLNDPQFGFILVGEGNKKQLLEERKRQNGLHNLSILPYQPPEVFSFSLACADIGIVTLSAGAEDLSVPSKTYNLLAAGVPLLVIASKTSELAMLVDRYECGVHMEEHEVDKMVLFLMEIKNDPQYLDRLKSNAVKASADFTPANAYQYKSLIKSSIHVPQAV